MQSRLLLVLTWMASMAPLVAPSAGQAATTCGATMSPLAFGSIADPSTASTTSSTITVRCDTTISLSVLGRVRVRMCLGIGKFASPRTMSDSGTHQLGFQIYTDALRTTPWGLRGGTPGALLLDMEYDVTLVGGASQSITVYASTPAQANAWAGAYSADYSGSFTALDYRYEEPVLFLPTPYPASCTSGGSGGAVGVPFGFNVTASVPRSCDFSAAPNLDFGSHPGPIASTHDSSTTLSLQCRGGTPWTLSLGAGQSPDGGQRRMRLDATDAYVRYDLYSDAGRSVPLSPGSTLSGSGSGTADERTIYGRVPTGQNVPAGLYSDKIIATITY